MAFNYILLILYRLQKSWLFYMWHSNYFYIFQRGPEIQMIFFVLELYMELYISLTGHFECNQGLKIAVYGMVAFTSYILTLESVVLGVMSRI